MAVPNVGNYISQDKTYHIRITKATPSNGVIAADYVAESSPVGTLSVSGNIGNYMWVFNKKQGKDGVAPFLLSFNASKRPAKRPYAIRDVWNGAYLANNTMLLTGTRSYVNENGITESIGLGTHTFAM